MSEAWERPVTTDLLVDSDSNSFADFVEETKLRFLAPILPTKGRIVEIGAGSGRFLVKVGRLGDFKLVATDFALYSMEAIGQNLIRAGLGGDRVRSRAEHLPFADGVFDAVLSGGLLEHFRDPAIVLDEMYRVLAPGGVFYADIVPRKLSIFRARELVRLLTSEYMSPGIFESSVSRTEWKRLLIRSGLRDVRVISAGVYPPKLPSVRAARGLLPMIEGLDGTRIADLFGWYYLCSGRKPG